MLKDIDIKEYYWLKIKKFFNKTKDFLLEIWYNNNDLRDENDCKSRDK